MTLFTQPPSWCVIEFNKHVVRFFFFYYQKQINPSCLKSWRFFRCFSIGDTLQAFLYDLFILPTRKINYLQFAFPWMLDDERRFYRSNLEFECWSTIKNWFAVWISSTRFRCVCKLNSFKYTYILENQFLSSGLLSSISVSDVKHEN